MKQKMLLIALLLTGSNLFVSSHNTCAVPVKKAAAKLHTMQPAQAPVADADNTVLGVSPSTMLLIEI